jgi:DNA-binding GntR family transcriptional regulator
VGQPLVYTVDAEPMAPQGGGTYQRLLEEIRAGRLTPGTRLREVEIAERLGVSRTPVREAMRQLEADGLVVHVPRHGATIRRLDYAEVMELYEMRAVLEGTAARLAARAASVMELQELRTLNAEFAATANPVEAAGRNRQFHQMLLESTRNRFLGAAVVGLQKTLLILGPTTLMDAQRIRRAVTEHDAVLDALEARDGAGAEAAMRRHIEEAQRLRIRDLRQLDALGGPEGGLASGFSL